MATIQVPEGAALVIRRLNAAGYEAWAVGGCVRDSLLGRAPKDWDICTNATPGEMQQVFSGWHTVETGLKHGTLTVVLEHVPYEVTTYRVDGAYTDHRHPDQVTFVGELAADLSRRDFTVNAMAYHPAHGLVDLFQGQADLAEKRIRCVGQAEKRFEEDALRILRALRFASVYGFQVEEETAAAIHALYPTLRDIAPERVRVELGKLLCGDGAAEILRAYTDVAVFLLPELAPSVGFAQHNPHHIYDVWEHTLHALQAVPATEVLRLTMLLHDSGKPACFTLDEQGVGHFYGHPAMSRNLAEAVLNRLRVDNATRDRVLLLVANHDAILSTQPKTLRRLLNRLGEEAVRQLAQVRRADRLGKGREAPEQVEADIAAFLQALDELLTSQPVFTLKQLAIGGRDLMALGLKGPAIGETLQRLLEAVMEESLPNEKEALLAAAGRQ